MSELLCVRDKICELQQGSEYTSEHQTAGDCRLRSTGHRTEKATKRNWQVAISLANWHSPSTRSVMRAWNREFKISGQIGELGQKDKLTFSSLAPQIEHGLSRGVSELKIVDAVKRAIAPSMQLHSYLEGKANFTLPTLKRILQAHSQERGAIELYKQLTSEIQSSKETPKSFLVRCLVLRQKILFASQEAESRWSMTQSMFLLFRKNSCFLPRHLKIIYFRSVIATPWFFFNLRLS